MTRPELHAWAMRNLKHLRKAEEALVECKTDRVLTDMEKAAAAKGIIDRGMALRAETQINVINNLFTQVRSATGKHLTDQVRVRMRRIAEDLWDLEEIYKRASVPPPPISA